MNNIEQMIQAAQQSVNQNHHPITIEQMPQQSQQQMSQQMPQQSQQQMSQQSQQQMSQQMPQQSQQQMSQQMPQQSQQQMSQQMPQQSQQQMPQQMPQQSQQQMSQQMPQQSQQQMPQQYQQQMPQQYQQQMPQQYQQQMPQQSQQQMPQQSQLPAHLMQYSTPMNMTMESLDAMGLQVDHWLKPDFAGIAVGDLPSIVPEVIASIKMVQNSGYVLGMGLRWGKQPARYDFTTDCVTSTKTGAPWVQSIMNALAVDPLTQPYRAVQLCFTLCKDVVAFDGTRVAKAGESLGYTTPMTNWAEWSNFYRMVTEKNLHNQTVKVKLTNKALDKNGNKWGVVLFELITESASQEQNAA